MCFIFIVSESILFLIFIFTCVFLLCIITIIHTHDMCKAFVVSYEDVVPGPLSGLLKCLLHHNYKDTYSQKPYLPKTSMFLKRRECNVVHLSI